MGMNWREFLKTLIQNEMVPQSLVTMSRTLKIMALWNLMNREEVVSLEEKPVEPKSQYAIPGLYYYDQQVCSIAKELRPSDRGELEITDLNRVYLDAGKLSVEVMGRGTAWLDTGSHENLASATDFVRVIERRQGLKIACLEEISHYKGWMTNEELERAILAHGSSSYGKYLKTILQKT